MAYSSSRKVFGPLGGGLNFEIHTLTDVQTSGSNTFEVDMRTIYGVFDQNKTGARALKVTTSGTTVTVTSATNDDDFEVMVIGV